VPRAEIEGEMGDSHPGLQARLMSQALRKLSGAIKQSNTAVIFTNQLRHKIGVMFGNPETTSGGMALKFYASVRLDIGRTPKSSCARIRKSSIRLKTTSARKPDSLLGRPLPLPSRMMQRRFSRKRTISGSRVK